MLFMFFWIKEQRKVGGLPTVIINRTASYVEATNISLTLLNDPSQSSRRCLSVRKSTLRGTNRISLINRR